MSQLVHLIPALRGRPQAEALVLGGESFPDISGWVRFYQTDAGVIVYAEITGLPQSEQPCEGRFFGFHIHQGGSCSGEGEGPFPQAMGHWNPQDCPHPGHAGDLPPLLGNRGLAVCACLTGRFCVEEVIGRVVIIHDGPDDFTSQPAGNSGAKIACGEIRRAGAMT